MKYITFILLFIFANITKAQVDSLPYYTIPDYPETHSAAHILARTIDGLGFRYYWATEGLRDEDYTFELGNEIRNIDATMKHMTGLVDMIYNTVLGQPNIRPKHKVNYTKEERREDILRKLKSTSDYLLSNADLDLEQRPIKYQRGEKTSEVPFWHIINGPLADALWHTGQIVSYRRAAGNPIPSGVNVFMGTKSE